MVLWISLPHATFGIISDGETVTDAAPIARWTIGKPVRDVAKYYQRKGAEIVAWCELARP
jgi:hypothetical protein